VWPFGPGDREYFLGREKHEQNYGMDSVRPTGETRYGKSSYGGKPGEDALEPLALLIAPVLINICYASGWVVEIFGRLLIGKNYHRKSRGLFLTGIEFSLVVASIPSVFWGITWFYRPGAHPRVWVRFGAKILKRVIRLSGFPRNQVGLCKRPILMRLVQFSGILAALLCSACGTQKDPCDNGGMLSDWNCHNEGESGYRNLVWVDSTTGRSVRLDTASHVAEPSRYQNDGSISESRSGFFLDSAANANGCRRAVTARDTGSWPMRVGDTLRWSDLRMQGYRKSGRYPEWERDNSCGDADLPGGYAWITSTNLTRFSDVEGPNHGLDYTSALGYRWPGGRIDGEYHSLSYTVKDNY
jgi:hypothetical protein